MKTFIRIISALLITSFLVVFLIWGLPLIKCEILTAYHGHEFTEVYKENTMLGNIQRLKVLEYSKERARVYFVTVHPDISTSKAGDVLTFRKENGKWKYDRWERTVWSSSGSADGYIWPYIR